jgi:hypothetical protein
MLWAMLYNHPVNTCFYLLDYLVHVGNRPTGKGEIVVGGIITYIARQFGVGEDEGIKPIEGNNRLNIETETLRFPIINKYKEHQSLSS